MAISPEKHIFWSIMMNTRIILFNVRFYLSCNPEHGSVCVYPVCHLMLQFLSLNSGQNSLEWSMEQSLNSWKSKCSMVDYKRNYSEHPHVYFSSKNKLEIHIHIVALAAYKTVPDCSFVLLSLNLFDFTTKGDHIALFSFCDENTTNQDKKANKTAFTLFL